MRSRRSSGPGAEEDSLDPAPLDGEGEGGNSTTDTATNNTNDNNPNSSTISSSDSGNATPVVQKLGSRKPQTSSDRGGRSSSARGAVNGSLSPSIANITTGTARGRTTDRQRLSPRSTSPGSWSQGGISRETSEAPTTRSSSRCSNSPPTSASSEAFVKEKMEDYHSRVYRRARIRSAWTCSISTLAVTVMSVFFVACILHSFTSRQCDKKGCKMPWMYPSYAPLKDFDTEHTPFASKYKLYLYREQQFDTSLEPRGVPVLFIPGNAGSYKQVRPIAAEAARQFAERVKEDESILGKGVRNLDFFTVDFNEDITAFHGRTLLDQAEYLNDAVTYILSLYHDSRRSAMDADLPDPNSVIIFGHSMGGIVARTMLTRPNYQQNSINTIVTLSAPHARAPVSFDKQIVDTYREINDYWRNAYSAKWANQNPLWHVTLISIAGGGLDTVVPSDYASIASLVPETHGFTVFTSSMPKVWLGVDHLAILWCDQLRKVVARSLLDVVDVKRAGQTKSRAERMRIFKKHYLTGLEPVAEKALSSSGMQSSHSDHVAKLTPETEPSTPLVLDEKSHSIIPLGHKLVLKNLGLAGKPHSYLMPIPPTPSPGGTRFTLLTDRDLKNAKSNVEILFCSVYPLQAGQAAQALSMKISGDGNGSTRLACKNAAEDVVVLPASTRDSKNSFDDKQPFSYLQFDLEELSEHQFVAVVDKNSAQRKGWVVAEFSDNSSSKRTADVSLMGMLSKGFRTQFSPDRPFMQELYLPVLHSSLLAWKLTVNSESCDKENLLFTPLVRQYLQEPYESKYFVNVRTADINLHGSAPFMPPPLRKVSRQGVSLQFWIDPTCTAPIDITLTFDFWGSLGRLVMRYRTVFAAFPLVIVALGLRKQFKGYDAGGHFVSFTEGLEMVISESLPFTLGLFGVAALFLAMQSARESSMIPTQFVKGIGGADASADPPTMPNYAKNDLLIGLQDPFFWFLGPLFALIAMGTVIIVNYLVLIIVHTLTAIYSLIVNRPGWVSNESLRRRTSMPASGGSNPKRRLLTTLLLLLSIATFIPFQFAYLVCIIVHTATTIRSLKVAREGGFSTSPHPATQVSPWSFYHYCQGVLVLMVWILPINLPVLVVWIHNLAVHWLTPFSSHHNVLSIMPVILLVETLTSTGKMIPRVESRLKAITPTLLLVLATLAGLYGISHAYMLHHLVNVFCAWLVVVHFSQYRWSLKTLGEVLAGDEDESAGKKMG